MPNKVRLARQMLEATLERKLQQKDVVEALGLEALGLAASATAGATWLSDIERGDYKDVPLEKARVLAEFFGCAIEDLFPAREAVA